MDSKDKDIKDKGEEDRDINYLHGVVPPTDGHEKDDKDKIEKDN